MTGPEPSVPRKFRIAFTNRRAARDSLQRIFAWPAERVLMAHGTPVEKDAQAFLRRAFGWLAARTRRSGVAKRQRELDRSAPRRA